MQKLNRSQYRQLEDLILHCKKGIEKGKWSKSEFALYAKKKLGFEITRTNVKYSANCTGVKFCKYLPRALKGVEETMLRSKSLRILARELIQLRLDLGFTEVSSDLRTLAQLTTEEEGVPTQEAESP